MSGCQPYVRRIDKIAFTSKKVYGMKKLIQAELPPYSPDRPAPGCTVFFITGG
jgi:hypothetical protein